MTDLIHPTSILGKNVKLGRNVRIGPFSIIHDNVELGDDVEVGSYSEIGMATPLAKTNELKIGAGAIIRSHTVIYTGSSIGRDLRTGHRVTIRENMKIGNGFQIGTLGDIQGDATIGDYVKCHSNVHICKTAMIEDCVWVFPFVVLTNDPHPPSEVLDGPTIKRYAVIATMSVVLPGVTVGEGALIGAHSLVRSDVEADTVCAGVPGKDRGPTQNIIHTKTGQPVYPWRHTFRRGYPEAMTKSWNEEVGTSD